MYIIVDKKPYAIREGKVFEVAFGEKGTIQIGKEIEDAKIEGKTYTYDEISRKFNLKARLQAKNEPTKELVDELNKQINALTKENEELKKKIEDLETSVNEEQVQAVASAIQELADEDNKEIEDVVNEIVEEVKEEKPSKKNK